MRRAIFPGSFDPLTLGHYSVVKRALTFLDEVIIAIGVNDSKRPYFETEARKLIIEKAFADEPRVKVATYDCLTVDFAKQVDATIILRGIRAVADFEYEKTVADANRNISGIDTILLFTEPQHSFISSTVVRDILRYGKNPQELLPPGIDLDAIIKEYNNRNLLA